MTETITLTLTRDVAIEALRMAADPDSWHADDWRVDPAVGVRVEALEAALDGLLNAEYPKGDE